MTSRAITRAAVCALITHALGCYNWIHLLPPGISFEGPPRPAVDVRFLADRTWVDDAGERHVEQHIFDAVLDVIAQADTFLILDMFLYNDFQGDPPETTRALAGELTEALISRKRERPGVLMTVISDPVNTVYGGIRSRHFDALEAAGIPVVLTRLDRLRDSNWGYSSFWRLLASPFGNREGGRLPSPFSDERVSVLSYLALLNFKANHRKLVLADQAGGVPVAIVTSANPHDGSSAHGNVALRFHGPAVSDLLQSELAVIAFSDANSPEIAFDSPAATAGDTTLRVLTEGKIRRALLETIAAAANGDVVDVAVFYLSDHGIVDALTSAHQRGARVRVLLDPNKDAFGREKSGIPNRPVAAHLHDQGVTVRWCDTHGEQCHAKMLLARYRDGHAVLVAGSANFTRRNLQDFNLETNVAIRGPADSPALLDASAYFEALWNNEPGRHYSTDYDAYADESLGKQFRYEIEERSGFSTF